MESACLESLSEWSFSLFISHLLTLSSLSAQVHGQAAWSLSTEPWPLGILERPWVVGSLNVPCLLTPPLTGSSIPSWILFPPPLCWTLSPITLDVMSISALYPSSSQLKHAIQVKDQSIIASAESPKFHNPIRTLLKALPIFWTYSWWLLILQNLAPVPLLSGSPPWRAFPHLLRHFFCDLTATFQNVSTVSTSWGRPAQQPRWRLIYQFISSSPTAILRVLDTYLWMKEMKKLILSRYLPQVLAHLILI